MDLPATHQSMTAAEFAALPEGLPYSQLVEGTLLFTATPNIRHQEIVGNLQASIWNHLRAHRGLGRVIVAPSDVALDDGNVFEPDLYFASAERSGIFTEQGTEGAPNLVVEVLSPSTGGGSIWRRGEGRAGYP